MRVLALTKYGPRAASTRQRLLQFLPYLAEHGVVVEYLPLLGDDHSIRLARGQKANPLKTMAAYLSRLLQLFSKRDFDLLWVHYELFPYLPGPFEKLARLSGAPVVCDYDDAIFHMYDDHRSELVRKFLGRKLVPLLESAAGCSCGNAYLLEYAKQHCENSVVIPTVVDTSIYRPLPEGGGLPVLGWIGSPSTWKYVEPLLPTIRRVAEQTGVTLRAVGAGPRARGIDFVDAREWEESREAEEVQGMDIGIMPLPDENWSRGKCGYKLVQYMACGRPVVASPVGVNSEIVAEGDNGYLAVSPDEWEAKLLRLIRQPMLRDAMGKVGRARAVERYSLHSQAPRMLQLLRSACKAGDRQEPS
jgi:glycosyltransferase involved in cell wall biosynthesis